MEADWASVWVAGIAGGIAVLSLAASLWAVLVARSAAASAKKQASIAARQYRLSAQPDVKMAIKIDRPDAPDQVKFHVDITRTGGVSEMWYQYSALFTYASAEDTKEFAALFGDTKSNRPTPWMNMGWSVRLGPAIIDLKPGDSLTSIKVHMDFRIAESLSARFIDDGDDDGIEMWTHYGTLTWTPESRIQAI